MQMAFIPAVWAQSLTIVEQDYEQAQQLAQQQQKLLLIDFYTTWCGPCKLLDKLVFRDTAVSNSIAGNFIVLRYNAEKDSVYRLTQKHHIGMYPSAVVLNTQQRVVCQQYGTGGPEKDLVANYTAFLGKARAMNSAGYFIPGVAASTQLSYPAFYSNYVNRVNVKQAQKQADQYWDTLTSLQQEVAFKIFCYFAGGNDKWNNYFLQHKADFQKLYGETDVQFASSMLIVDKVSSALAASNRPRFDSAIQLAQTHLNGAANERYINLAKLRMLQAEGRWNDACTWLETLKKQGLATAEDIARFGQAVVNRCDNAAVQNKALQWMQAIVEENPDYENLQVYAWLLHKAGDKPKAVVIMKKAIEAGKAGKEDTSKEEKWLSENTL